MRNMTYWIDLATFQIYKGRILLYDKLCNFVDMVVVEAKPFTGFSMMREIRVELLQIVDARNC